jgi:membrane protein
MRKREGGWFFIIIRNHLQVILQKISLSINFFFKNELLNHAGAAAFFFLLSVTPVFLLMLISFERYLTSYPDISVSFFAFLKSINENLDKDLLVKIGLLNVNTAAIGIFGFINLLWAAGLILTSIQRGLGIIFPAEKIRPQHVINFLSFILLGFFLLLAILATLASMGLNFFQSLLSDNLIIQTLFQTLFSFIRRLLPFLITFLVIFLTYRLLPPRKPKTASSLVGAFLCALSIILLHILFSKFFNISQYNVIYGLIGSLILMVLWVHFSFILFFFFAEYIFVTDRIDVLLLERLYFFKLLNKKKEKKIGKFLFSHPERIFDKYAKRYNPGETLFAQGDESKDIFFIFKGSISIYQTIDEDRQKITTLKEGEVFGEMAYLLNENRTATAVAETESILLVIVPDIFEELLHANYTFSRNLIQLLSNRLRQTQFRQRP